MYWTHIQFLSSDSVKTHLWHTMCCTWVRLCLLHACHILCAAHNSYFMCCMLVRCMWVRLPCAAQESVFLRAACKITATLWQRSTKANKWNGMQANVIKCVDMQKIAFSQVFMCPYSNPLRMTMYCTTWILNTIMVQDLDSMSPNKLTCFVHNAHVLHNKAHIMRWC